MDIKQFIGNGYYLAKYKKNIYFVSLIGLPPQTFLERGIAKIGDRNVLGICLSSYYMPMFFKIKDADFIYIQDLIDGKCSFKLDFRELISRWFSYSKNISIGSFNINDYVKILENYLDELSEMEG